MKYLSLVAIAFMVACGPSTPLTKQFSEANKIKVLMYAGNDVPQVHYETNDVDKIKAWTAYIDETHNGNVSCGNGTCNYEGKLVLYFTETDSNEMRFGLGCKQIAYTVDGKSYTKPLTDAGVKYLESLKQTE